MARTEALLYAKRLPESGIISAIYKDEKLKMATRNGSPYLFQVCKKRILAQKTEALLYAERLFFSVMSLNSFLRQRGTFYGDGNANRYN